MSFSSKDTEAGQSASQQPNPSDWYSLLSRREFISRTGRALLFITLANFGGTAAIQSPMGRFFLSQPDMPVGLPNSINLTPEQVKKALVEGYGSSYVKGEGGISPVLLIAKSVTDAGIGDWVGNEYAVSGSPVADMQNQANQLKSFTSPSERRGRSKILVTDTGYNSVTEEVFSDPDNLALLQDILYKLDHPISITDIPGLIKGLNEICDAFFVALDATENDLVSIDNGIINILKPDGVHLYTFPPLERVAAFEHVGRKHDPSDKSYKIPIRGNPMRELIAKGVSVNGTNMAGKVAKRLNQQNPNTPVVLVFLSNILGVRDYQTRQDEHPDPEAWIKIAGEELVQIQINNETLRRLIDLNSR